MARLVRSGAATRLGALGVGVALTAVVVQSTAVAAPALGSGSIVTVSPDAPGPWASIAFDCESDDNLPIDQGFSLGPATPPLGVGSRFLQTHASSEFQVYRTTLYDGTLLSAIQALSYATYTKPLTGAALKEPAALRLTVDSDGDDAADTSLFFIPANNGTQGAVANETWQTWDAKAGGFNEGGDTGSGGLVTLADYAAAHPLARIANNDGGQPTGGGLAFVSGCAGANQTNAQFFVDRLHVATTQSRLFDFEPAATATSSIVKVVNGQPSWVRQAYDCDLGDDLVTTQRDVWGPPTPPLGVGSHQFRMGDNSLRTELYRTPLYDGERLSSIRTLTYSTFAVPNSSNVTPQQPPYLRLSVDTNGDAERDTSLFFFPGNNIDQAPVANGEWQSWDVANGRVNEDGDTGLAGATSLAAFVADHPNATLVNNNGGQPNGGALAIMVGCGGDNQRNGVFFADAVSIGLRKLVNNGGVDALSTFDFEPLIPKIRVGNASINEGDSGTRTVTVPVTLSAPSTSQVSVHYTTRRDTALAGRDYVSKSGTLSIPAGQTSATLSFQIVGDRVYELTQRFAVLLSSPFRVTIADGTGVVTIFDNDRKPRLTISNASIVEGDSGAKLAKLFVKITGATEPPVSVAYRTQNGSAVSGSDYSAKTGRITVRPGTQAVISISVFGNLVHENTETFAVLLSAARNAVIDDGRGDVTIFDND
jgi:hypothetical protein